MGRDFNWGIMGPGFIANKVFPDFRLADGACVLGAASNTSGKAKAFADKWGIDRAYENYIDLVKDQDIDIIYITTPGAFHMDGAILAMEHGKHVLCEKPISLNADEMRKMAEAARKNSVFLMEAMWTRFIPAIQEIKRLVDDGVIGEVHHIVSDFSYDVPFDPDYHLFDPKAGGGTLVDGGIYPLSFSSFIYGGAPKIYTGFANVRNGVDVRDTVIMQFENGGMSSFICGADTVSPWDSIIYGTKGLIRIPSFYAAKSFEIEYYGDDLYDLKARVCQRVEMPFEGLGYQFEINEVMDCIGKGLGESPVMPLDESASLMQVMDDLRKTWGVVYPGEA
jgi:predicted dehydrogenase